MAIQLKRCVEEARQNSDAILLDGQPLYTEDTHKLYIGDGSTKAKNLTGTEVGLPLQSTDEGRVILTKPLSDGFSMHDAEIMFRQEVIEEITSVQTNFEYSIHDLQQTINSDISDLENNKADKSTTLSGYGITNAYTKTEVDSKDSSTLTSAKSYTDTKISGLDVSATTLTSLETISSISETNGKIAVTKQSIDTYSKSEIDNKDSATLAASSEHVANYQAKLEAGNLAVKYIDNSWSTGTFGTTSISTPGAYLISCSYGTAVIYIATTTSSVESFLGPYVRSPRGQGDTYTLCFTKVNRSASGVISCTEYAIVALKSTTSNPAISEVVSSTSKNISFNYKKITI